MIFYSFFDKINIFLFTTRYNAKSKTDKGKKMEAEQPLEDLIIIHPHLLQKFMRQGKDFANLLALYAFYTYQAKLQKTNQPLCTDEFTRRGMNWAIDRVKKKILDLVRRF